MPGVDRDDVEWCYRTLLKRPPESEDVISSHLNASIPDLRTLVEKFVSSPEYERRHDLSAFFGENIVVRRYTPYGFVFSVDLSYEMVPIEYIVNDYEALETEFIFRHLREGQYCVDAGARHGWFTCVMAAKVGRSGKVYAFDPDWSIHPFLMSVIAENRFHQVEVFRVGLSDRVGKLYFHPSDATVRSGEPLGDDYPVDVAPLDDAIARREKPISLLKMDIEGHEWPALRGAGGILRQDRPLLLVELNDEMSVKVGGYGLIEMVRWLIDQFGYLPVGLDGADIEPSRIDAVIASRPVQNLVFRPG